MITQVQQDMENSVYEALKKGEVGKKVIAEYAKYEHQASIEEMAETMCEGYKGSWVGKIVKELEARGEVIGFEAMCNAAFKAAMLRLLKDETGFQPDPSEGELLMQ